MQQRENEKGGRNKERRAEIKWRGSKTDRMKLFIKQR